MPGALFFLTLLVLFPQGTRIMCSLCTRVCARMPPPFPTPTPSESTDQFTKFKQPRYQIPENFLTVGSWVGKRGFIHAPIESRNSVWTHPDKSQRVHKGKQCYKQGASWQPHLARHQGTLHIQFKAPIYMEFLESGNAQSPVKALTTHSILILMHCP